MLKCKKVENLLKISRFATFAEFGDPDTLDSYDFSNRSYT